MKPAVLCMNRPDLAEGIHQLPITSIPEKNFHFINRTLVDDPNNVEWAAKVPQVLGYCVVCKDDKYLSYSRQKPTEQRLAGKRSIGIGGHVDITDIFMNRKGWNIKETIKKSIYRELSEELGLDINNHVLYLDQLLVSRKDAVSSVHLGYVEYLHLLDSDTYSIGEELHDVQWLSLEELKQTKDQYENWSKIIIEDL